MTTPLLVTPNVRYHSSWLESLDEWDGEWMHGSSYFSAEAAGLDVTKPADFAAWVEDLLVQADPSVERPEGYVSATNRWIILDDVYCGAIQFRHRLTPGLTISAGNIGYGIRPSYRRRGLASFALTSILPFARRLGLEKVLLTTDDDNVGSARVIENHGGQLWDVLHPEDYPDRDAEQPWRRYWIPLTEQPLSG